MNPVLDTLAFISMPGGWEWIVILLIGLMIFGKRLPDVGKSVGKTIVEFKKGLRSVEDEIETASSEKDRKEMLPPPDPAAKTDNHAAKTPAQATPHGGSGD